MKIQLIQGEFNSQEALNLIQQMIQIKIKYHEDKILKNVLEEDIKYRESKIKKLQDELYHLKKMSNEKDKKIKMESVVHIMD